MRDTNGRMEAFAWAADLTPPRAARRPRRVSHHGLTLEDPYAWLRDPGYPKVADPEIRAHLEAENRYFAAVMAPLAGLRRVLVDEMRARIVEEDAGVPFRLGAFLYQWRYEAGCEHRRWYRAPLDRPQDWRLVLDEPALAEGAKAFRLGGFAASPCGRFLAWTMDRDGAERFTLVVRDLETGETVGEPIPETIGAPVFLETAEPMLAYVALNREWRPWRAMLHRLGRPAEEDAVLYEEPDPGFFVSLTKTASRRFLVVSSASHDTSEVRLVDTADPAAPARLVAPRRAGHEYAVDHDGRRLVIRSNRRQPDFDLYAARADAGEDAWEPLITGDEDRYILDFAVLRRHVAVVSRIAGEECLEILDGDGRCRPVRLDAVGASIDLAENFELDAPAVRIGVDSLARPARVYDVDPETREPRLLKEAPIAGPFDPDAYVEERMHARGHDGARIPVTLVRRRDGPRPGPLHLYGYGAYGIAMRPRFSSHRLSLLERGVTFAIAHVRGGDECGREWYEQARRFLRQNSFHDFIAAARHLVAAGFARTGAITISGGSAGGTLMGVAANWTPELWAGIVAHVPFVDVLNTMLDETLPLTPIEWPEWGDPLRSADAFRYIRSYSPYENVLEQAYPPIMVTAGINDPRVTYWEPAKWVARLRERRSDDRPVILKTEMEAGHAGRSGRYAKLDELAEEYAFILACHGLAGGPG
ncbi:MAG: oligopeptidase B [Rhodothalassiaceae bacterium]|nr:MAG: oligopeptidase B [Rhodothalassiaceae bacterium]